jgi:hypothetical protein
MDDPMKPSEAPTDTYFQKWAEHFAQGGEVPDDVSPRTRSILLMLKSQLEYPYQADRAIRANADDVPQTADVVAKQPPTRLP